jgi:CheY-like chemotaxis protein
MGTRVLLAEDEPLIARSFADLLEAEGYDVHLASDGAEALDVARGLGGALGALVTDLWMPRMGGEDLIRELRAERPGLPVVVVTGAPPRGGEEALRSRAGGDGPLLLLGKPACCGQLAAALRRAVGCATGASAPDDRRTEVGLGLFPSDALMAADNLTSGPAGSSASRDVAAFGPGTGARWPAPPGPKPFGSTGNDGENIVTGAAATNHGQGDDGGVPVGVPRAAYRMEGGPGDDTHEADDASAAAGGQGGGDRIPLFFGDEAAGKPGEGGDAVWARVDLAPPGHVDGLVPPGGARKGHGDEGVNLIRGNGEDYLPAGLGGGESCAGAGNLFLDGAAAWGSGAGLDHRTVGDGLQSQPVERAGSDASTGGAGDDAIRLLAIAPFRATVTDFWPGAGSNTRPATARGLFPSRGQALASGREGPDA